MSPTLVDFFPLPAEPLLSDVPDAVIRVACPKCRYGWQYDRDERIRSIGDVPLRKFMDRTTRACRSRAAGERCAAQLLA